MEIFCNAFFTQYNALDIQLVAYKNCLLLFIAPWFEGTTVSFSPFTVEVHLGCFQFGAIMNKAAINFWSKSLSGYMFSSSQVNTQAWKC